MDFVEETLIKKYKTAGNAVDLVEVLAFSLWKPATLVTILYGRSRLRLNICLASHFIHASAYGYVSLTINPEELLQLLQLYFIRLLVTIDWPAK